MNAAANAPVTNTATCFFLLCSSCKTTTTAATTTKHEKNDSAGPRKISLGLAKGSLQFGATRLGGRQLTASVPALFFFSFRRVCFFFSLGVEGAGLRVRGRAHERDKCRKNSSSDNERLFGVQPSEGAFLRRTCQDVYGHLQSPSNEKSSKSLHIRGAFQEAWDA